jgi:hypothetical protein
MSVKRLIYIYSALLILALLTVLVIHLTPPVYQPPCASIPNNPYHAVCVLSPGESVQAPLSGHGH